MPGMLIGGGNYGGNPSKDRVVTQESSSNQQTTFRNEGLVDALATLLGSLNNFSASNFQEYISNPFASPLFQGQYAAALNALAPSEDLSRQRLTDQFRAAGGLRSGAYGNSLMQLEDAILGNRGQTMANILGQSYAPTLQALLQPTNEIAQLINALKGTTSTSTSTGYALPNYGGGGGMGVGGGGGGGGNFATPYYDSLINRSGWVDPTSRNFGYVGGGYSGGGGGNNNGGQNWYIPDTWTDDAGGLPAGIIGGGSGSYFDPSGGGSLNEFLFGGMPPLDGGAGYEPDYDFEF